MFLEGCHRWGVGASVDGRFRSWMAVRRVRVAGASVCCSRGAALVRGNFEHRVAVRSLRGAGASLCFRRGAAGGRLVESWAGDL